MPKRKTSKAKAGEAKFGPPSEFNEARGKHRLTIIMTEAQTEAIKEIVAKQNAEFRRAGTNLKQTSSSWGFRIILDALKKEGYEKW